MAYMVMAYIDVAYIVTAYTGMAPRPYIAMACKVTAYIGMAYAVMALSLIARCRSASLAHL